MKHKASLGVLFLSLIATHANADTVRWVGMLSLGPVWAGGLTNQTLELTPDIVKTFADDQTTNTVFESELFLGLQAPLAPSVQGQFGFAAGATSSNSITGDIWDDGDPLFNNFEYEYNIQHTYILMKSFFSFESEHWITPWVSVGLGVGFNHAYSFVNTPNSSDDIASPNFISNTMTSFTYTLGIGIKTALTPHWELGVGYEFADWGKSSLGPADGQTTNTGPSNDHLYTNGILFHVTYLGGVK